MIRGTSAAGSIGVIVLLLVAAVGLGQQPVASDDGPQLPPQAFVYAGEQALLTCNGLFVSGRTLEQLYAAELRLDLMPLASPDAVRIDLERKTVAVNESGKGTGPTMRAAYREGLGCVVMGPGQTF